MQPNQETKKPFFARLLEDHDQETAQEERQDGRQEMTLKYPSDNDEWPF